MLWNDAANGGDGFTTSEYNAEKTEIQDLCTYLINTHPTKTFIILNWEGDNAIGGYGNITQQLWNNYVQWIQARAEGVRAAQTPSSKVYSGLEFVSLYKGETDNVWVDDDAPCGATTYADADEWNWVTANPDPASGSRHHQALYNAGLHQHYFGGASNPLVVGNGDSLFAYVYLDPAQPPSAVMLQWNDGIWDHRAYWGANLFPWGTNGTASRRYMGPLPPAGKWVRLEVPADQVGLNGSVVNGMAFSHHGGKAAWDRAGKVLRIPCGAPDPDPLKNRCVIDYVAPQVDVDYYSYSAYNSTNQKYTNTSFDLTSRLSSDINLAITKINKPGVVTPTNFILGEYGFWAPLASEKLRARHFQDLMIAVENVGISYAIHWQGIDDNLSQFPSNNPSLIPFAFHGGLVNGKNGVPYFAGNTFSTLLGLPAGGTLTPSYFTGGPTLVDRIFCSSNLPAISSWPNYITSFNLTNNPPTDLTNRLLVAFGKNFSPGTGIPGDVAHASNRVHIIQGGRQFILPNPNDTYWYESPNADSNGAFQINATMPPGLRPSYAVAYVKNASGFTSDSRTITISCNTCPTLGSGSPPGPNVPGIISWPNYNQIFKLPGPGNNPQDYYDSLLVIKGERFSPGNGNDWTNPRNRVYVFQHQTTGDRLWVLPDATNNFAWYESPSPVETVNGNPVYQINVPLPRGLEAGQALVWVVNNGGYEISGGLPSADQGIPIRYR